jgi:hypothetical protein
MTDVTFIPNELDESIINTLNHCITKMSDCLKKKFNPEEKESRSLFRLFCTAINIRAKKMADILRFINKSNQKLKKSDKTGASQDNIQKIIDNNPANNSNPSCKNPKRGIIPGAALFWRKKKLA